MKIVFTKKIKPHIGGYIKCSVMLILLLVSFFFMPFSSHASNLKDSPVVRVGFFGFDGYHETNEENQRSGYGYEYLHEMAKYTGWVFEYVDGTWEECQEMLKNGKIDILTSAQYSQSRDEFFDFSTTSMGTSYAQLTVSSDNTKFKRNDYPEFNGIHIGLLKGNSRNDRLAEFAKEKGFSFTSTIYETQKELDYNLKTGAVDAVLTSSLRKLEGESIIAQFAPSPFYAIVKEGNDKLLQEVNMALESIEMNNPAFRYNLYQEYYRVDTGNTFVLSREEKEYLDTKPTIRAVIRPEDSPISLWEEDKFQGIAADIMSYLLLDSGINIQYISANTPEASYQLIKNGGAEIACLFESDYNLAEQYNMRITEPYLKTNYSLIFHQQNSQDIKKMQNVAVVGGQLAGETYLQANYPNAQQIPVVSTNAAIEAVVNRQADFALVNVYSAEKALINYPNLRASFVDGVAQQFSIGVSQDVDLRLYSILDKKINTMSSQSFNDVISRHTMFQQVPISLSTYIRQHPLEFLLLNVVVFGIIIFILIYIIMTNKRHAKNIYDLAYVDKLTNLWNLNGFMFRGETVLAQNAKEAYAVILVDISNFSGINENYGRHIGDKVIQGMGGILSRFCNEKTVVAHMDADNFLILFSYNDKEDMHTTLAAIRRMLSSYKIDDLSLLFHAYMGVGYIEATENALVTAFDHARIARNECTLDQPIVYMDKALQQLLLRGKSIREHAEMALQQGEFLVFYQPKVDMTNKEIIGAEALIRWNHSKLGFLTPGEFISIIEQNGFITEVDFFVLEQACKIIRKWIDLGKEPIVISVNQSRAHFVKSNYIERLQNMIIKYNIPASYIELEITETLFGQKSISNEIIKRIKSLGFLISIDDFGSGYSSLHLLHQISVDILKIDKGLLDEIDNQEKMRNIIRRVVQIAADLEVEVICEGVETREQMEFLLGVNCKYAQGFLFSKPLPQAEFELIIEKGLI